MDWADENARGLSYADYPNSLEQRRRISKALREAKRRGAFTAQTERDDALAKLALFWCAAQKELGDAFSWSASVRYSDVAHMVEGLRVATLLAEWEEKRFILSLQSDHLSGDLLDALARFRKLGTTDD